MDFSTSKRDSQAGGLRETHLTGSWTKSADTADPWLNLVLPSGELYPVCCSSAGMQRWQELQRCFRAASHTVGCVPFPPSHFGMTFHLQQVVCAVLVASLLGFGSLWPLLQRTVMPLELLLRRTGCVCTAHLVTSPVTSHCCLFHWELQSVPLRQLSAVLLMVCLWGPRWDSLCHCRVGFNVHFTTL